MQLTIITTKKYKWWMERSHHFLPVGGAYIPLGFLLSTLLRLLFKAAHAATCSLPTHLANENSTHARTYWGERVLSSESDTMGRKSGKCMHWMKLPCWLFISLKARITYAWMRSLAWFTHIRYGILLRFRYCLLGRVWLRAVGNVYIKLFLLSAIPNRQAAPFLYWKFGQSARH